MNERVTYSMGDVMLESGARLGIMSQPGGIAQLARSLVDEIPFNGLAAAAQDHFRALFVGGVEVATLNGAPAPERARPRNQSTDELRTPSDPSQTFSQDSRKTLGMRALPRPEPDPAPACGCARWEY